MRKTKETNLESDQAVEKTQENAVQPDKTQSDYGVHNRSRCGGALRTARENQGLSIQDIASRLRLGIKQVESIEAAPTVLPGVDPFSYFIQAGAFRTPEDAEQQRARLVLLGVQAKVSEREPKVRTDTPL